MAEVKRGISPDLLIHPGETISDLLEDRNITQKELAKRAGVSEPFLSDVIRGKKDISKGLAMGLEYALGVPKSFWLNLQANYDAELLSILETQSITDKERTSYASIQEIVCFLKMKGIIPSDSTEEQMILLLRKYFKISDLSHLNTIFPTKLFLPEKEEINPDVLGAWLCLCEAQSPSIPLETSFEENRINDLINSLKEIMRQNEQDPRSSITALMAKYGIYFDIIQHFKGAPVQGFLSRKKENTYHMILTMHNVLADIFWNSLFYEIGHIVNKDVKKTGAYITLEDSYNMNQETTVIEFAANSLLDINSYKRFLTENTYTISSIKEYADSQNVPSYIVIGRLEKDGIIPLNQFQEYKLEYKWA